MTYSITIDDVCVTLHCKPAIGDSYPVRMNPQEWRDVMEKIENACEYLDNLSTIERNHKTRRENEGIQATR